jgi:spore coat protein A
MRSLRVTLVLAVTVVSSFLVLGVNQATAAPTPLIPTTLVKYLDPLPIPPVAQQTAPGYYEMSFEQGIAQFHPGIPPTRVWGYNDGFLDQNGYLGPSFVVRKGEELNVQWTNNLPLDHILQPSIDYTLDGAMQGPDVRAVTHLHGGHVADTSDGGPDDGIVPGESQLFHYPNNQDAALLWYHDHAMGITRLNPYAGLAGAYIVRDDYEDALNLPGGPSDPGGYEVPLVIQDKLFTVDTATNESFLGYPTVGILPAIHPTWVPEMFGDTIVVNGKIWPYLQVEPRKYRFRLINGSNARFYSLKFTGIRGGHAITPTIYQIGAEGGLLPAVVPLTQLLIAPGERADIIVDFTPLAGMTLTLKNGAKAPYPAGTSPDPQTTGQILQVRVGTTMTHPDNTVIPAAPRPIAPLNPAQAAATRDVKMTEVLDPATGFPTQLRLEDKLYRDPVTLTPAFGTTEVWRFINTTADTHPMHLHLVQFQVLDRQNFDVARYLATGQLRFSGNPKLPDPNERGWKDTVRVNPGEVVRIIATFDHAGTYPVHCHILEHEENEMMRPFTVQ